MGFLSRYKGVIIAVVLIVAVFVGYAILKKPASDSNEGLQLNVVNSNPAGGVVNAKDPSSALVLQLLAIQNIVFDTKFFEDPVYRQLVDQSRPLGEREVGRPNPFLRIGIDGIQNASIAPADANQGETQGFVQTPTVSTSTTLAPTTPVKKPVTPVKKR